MKRLIEIFVFHPIFWTRYFIRQTCGSIAHQFDLAALRAEARRYERCSYPEEKELRRQLLLRIRNKGREELARKQALIEKANRGEATLREIQELKGWMT